LATINHKELLPSEGVEYSPHSPFYNKIAPSHSLGLKEKIKSMLEWRLQIGADIVQQEDSIAR
jgi:hypothetical protein